MTQTDQRQYAEIILWEDLKNTVRRSKTVGKEIMCGEKREGRKVKH